MRCGDRCLLVFGAGGALVIGAMESRKAVAISSPYRIGIQAAPTAETESPTASPSVGAYAKNVAADRHGTLATSAIALIIAVPVSVGAALVIEERLPARFSSCGRHSPGIARRDPRRGRRFVGAMTFGSRSSLITSLRSLTTLSRCAGGLHLRGDPGNREAAVSGLVLAVWSFPAIAASRPVPAGAGVARRAIALGMSEWGVSAGSPCRGVQRHRQCGGA